MTQITNASAAGGCRRRKAPRMSNFLILLSAVVCSPAMGDPEGNQIIINEPSFSENKDPASDYAFSASVFWQARKKLVKETYSFSLTVKCGGGVISQFFKRSIWLNVYTKDYKSENTTVFDVPCSSDCSLNISAIPYDTMHTTPVTYQVIFFATAALAPLKPPAINEVGIVDSVVSVHWKVNKSDSCGPIQNVEVMLRSGMKELRFNSTNTTSPYVIDLHQHPSSLEIALNNFISLNVSLRYSNNIGTSKWSSWFPVSRSGNQIIINEPSISENKDPASDYAFSASVFWQAQRKLVKETYMFNLTVRCGGGVITQFFKRPIRLDVYTKDYKSENTTVFDVPCSSNCSLNISAVPYNYGMMPTTPVTYQVIFFATGALAPLKPPAINEVGIVDSVVSVHWKVNERDSCSPIQNVEVILRSDMKELQFNSTNTTSPYVIDLHQHPSTLEIAQNNFISLNVSLRYSNNFGTSKWSSWYPASGSGSHSINTTYIQKVGKNEFLIIGSVSVGMVVCFVIISIGIIAIFYCYSSKRKRGHRVVDRTHLQPPELTEETLSTIPPDVDTEYQRSNPDDKDDEYSDCSYSSNNDVDVELLPITDANVNVPSHYVQL